MDTTTLSAIERAADMVGVPAIAAECGGISVQAVYKWIKKRQAPTDRCGAVSRATGGRVPVVDLLPPVLRADLAPVASRRGTRQLPRVQPID